MNKIVCFGAFDVNDYGDLLLPFIAKQELKSIASFNLCAASPVGDVTSTLSDVAPCVSVLDVLDEIEAVDGVLIGGGDIIRALPEWNKGHVSSGRECFSYSDLWIGPAFFYPQHTPIVWNAVEVPEPFSNAQHELVKSVLMRTNYLSVRNNASKQYLLEVWPDADIAIVPDSLWGVSKIWSKAELQSAYQALFARLNVEAPNRSIIFDFNRRDLDQYTISDFAELLDGIAQQMGAQPLLIAFSSCRDDDVLMQEIGARMSTHPIILCSPLSLREMVACVAFAHAHVGSSMSSFIVASAFCVPGVVVAKNSIAESAIVAGAWSQVSDVLWTINFEKRQIELDMLHKRMHRALDLHWNRIRLEFQAAHLHFNQSAHASWRSVIDYQSKIARTIFEVMKERQQIIEVDNILALANQKNSQASLIKNFERSKSWKATRPLRVAVKKYPFIKLLVFAALKIARFFYSALFKSSADLKISSVEWPAPNDMVEQIKAYQNTAAKNKKKYVFYTAIFGDYDSLFLPEVIHKDIDYICFTDRPKNDYGVWQIQASPYYHSDPVRMARYIKTHPHRLFPEHEIAIWLDANVVLRADVKKYIQLLDSEHVSLGFIPHPKRDCFYQEADECKRLEKDDLATIDAQVAFYRKADLKEHAGLFETNFMIIRLTDDVVFEMFHLWWQEIQRFSRRDQLGLVWAFSQKPVSIVHLLPKRISVREHADFYYYSHQESRQFYLPAQITKLGQLKDPFDGVPFITIKEERLSQVKQKAIDIIVCVYNALEDVQLCLQSARQYLLPEHKIIIVNDHSEQETTEYLRKFAANDRQVILIENEVNLGYVQSANRGLSTATADFCIMLNSDTIVCENWALKMLDVAMQDPEIGIVSPLSNAAGVQSLPDIKSGKNNTAINCIPDGVSLADIDYFLEKVSLAYAVPRVLLAHGFCFGIKREVMNRIGLFDVVNFSRYYGEENDYCFRAFAAGFCSAIVTNTFVYHRKSRSIVEEERIVHMKEAGQKLRQIYGVDTIRAACLQGENHPLLQRMRSLVAGFYQSASKRR